ncbi:MAG: hypothetical protein AAF618_04305 [Pseudomonadota bacterium]
MKRSIVDTNLIVLLLSYRNAPHLIGKHRRIRKYDQNLAVKLVELMDDRSVFLVPVPVVTEASNLLGDEHQSMLPGAAQSLQEFCLSDRVEVLSAPSETILGTSEYLKFGFADAGILYLAWKENAEVLTDDFRLAGALRSAGKPTTNLLSEAFR